MNGSGRAERWARSSLDFPSSQWISQTLAQEGIYSKSSKKSDVSLLQPGTQHEPTFYFIFNSIHPRQVVPLEN